MVIPLVKLVDIDGSTIWSSVPSKSSALPMTPPEIEALVDIFVGVPLYPLAVRSLMDPAPAGVSFICHTPV